MSKDRLVLGLIIIFFAIFSISSVLYLIHSKEPIATIDDSEKIKETTDTVKLNQYQDFIYFEKESVVSKTQNIKFRTPIINLKGTEIETLNLKLKEEEEEKEKSLKRLSDYPLEEGNVAQFEADGIREVNFRTYETSMNNEQLTLFMADYTFDIINGLSKQSLVKAYTFDTKKGSIVSKEDILMQFSVTEALIKTRILDKLKLTLKKDSEIANATLALEKLIYNQDYSLTITKDHELRVNYIVKVNEVLYNGVILMNQ